MSPWNSLLFGTRRLQIYLRNKSWKPECVGSFNMDQFQARKKYPCGNLRNPFGSKSVGPSTEMPIL
jgi:hypothetical protein